MQLFKIQLETDTHPDSVPTCEACEACEVARERLMTTRIALRKLDRSLHKSALQVDFDPATGRLNLTYPDGETFGHIEIEQLKAQTP